MEIQTAAEDGFGATEPKSGHNGIRKGCGTDGNDGHSNTDESSRAGEHAREGTAPENLDAASNRIRGHKFKDGRPARSCYVRTKAMKIAST